MSDATVTFIGATDGATADMAAERSLYLKMFAGEVLTAFPESTAFIDKHRVKRAMNGGKSAQFPLIGRMPAAEYHTPGTEILGQEAPLAEKEISVDRLLISHMFVDNLDQKLAHFEARGELAKNMSRRLGQTYDNHLGRELAIAAATGTPIAADTSMGGTIVTDADLGSATAATKLEAWVSTLFGCRETFDEKWVNDGTIWLALKPSNYYFLIQSAMSSGYAIIDTRIGGQGSISSGTMGPLAGIEPVSFPGLPTSNYSAEAFHAVDCRNTVGLVWTAGAIGTVKAFDIGVETEYQISRQGTLVVAKYAMGHGVLQAECAQLLRTAAPGA